MNYEYCVMHARFPDSPHRGPMSEQDCIDWIRTTVTVNEMSPSLFYVAFREVSEWRSV